MYILKLSGCNGKEGFLGVSCLRVHQLEKKVASVSSHWGRTHLTLQSGIYVNFFDTLTVFHKKVSQYSEAESFLELPIKERASWPTWPEIPIVILASTSCSVLQCAHYCVIFIEASNEPGSVHRNNADLLVFVPFCWRKTTAKVKGLFGPVFWPTVHSG